MFILSVKTLKGKLILLTAAVAAAAIIFVACLELKKPPVPEGEPSEKSAAAESALNYSAKTEEERRAFIKSLGYTVKDEPQSVSEVIIPEEFDEVYTEYNNLQKKQNLNLEKYKGKAVKKLTYTVTNYPGYEDRDCIRLTLLVYKDKIIGGDVCSVELDGFMSTFK